MAVIVLRPNKSIPGEIVNLLESTFKTIKDKSLLNRTR